MQLTLTRTPSQRPLVAIVALALVLVVLVATALVAASWRTDVSPLFRNGAIVFSSNGDLFVADQLAGTPRVLLSDPGFDHDPVFSPQGDRVAFVRFGAPGSDPPPVMTVRLDGSDLREVFAGEFTWRGAELAWAPDGGAILVTRDDWTGTGPASELRDPFGLTIAASDGSGSVFVDAGPDAVPGPGAWRPDGRSIAFLGSEERGVSVFIVDADGTDVRRLLTETGRQAIGPTWSPDGSRLSFVSRGEIDQRITIVDVDANGTATGSQTVDLGPEAVPPTLAWSPDGRRLAFLVRRGWLYDVTVVDPDGSGFRIVGTAPSPHVDTVDWSPDGRSVVINGLGLQRDPASGYSRNIEMAWLMDAETGALTEVLVPIHSWQRLSP